MTSKVINKIYPIIALCILVIALAIGCGLPGDPIDETYVEVGYFDQLFVGGVPVGGGGGATTFLALTDTPAAYAGHALEYVRVNAATNALEFNAIVAGGDVVGPAASTDNAIVRFDGLTGKLIQDSGITIDDVNGVIIPTTTGIDYNPGVDIDVDIATVGVTGTPRIYWDEVNNRFSINQSLYITQQLMVNNSMYLNDTTHLYAGWGNDNDYVQIDARDTGVGWAEVARIVGAADPYFSMGGTQEFKFYNSGTADLDGNVTASNTVIVDTTNGIDYNPGADQDVDIATIGVTGTPLIKWDESDDDFNINKGLDVTGDIDFNTYKAIEMVCDNGATVPAAPVTGQWFLHTPTGRNVLMQYDGANWINIASIGSMTMYVDKTDGTDGINYGGAVDAGAFASVQYAVDRIPGQVNGDVIIYINAEDYDETVTIIGKAFTGNYTITLQGTLTVASSGTSSANGITGTGATQGSVTDTGNMGIATNLIIYLDSDGDYRIVDSATANTATICGTFTSQPLSGENYVIYDWGTSINNINVEDNQINIICYDIEFDTAIGVTYNPGSSSILYRCNITGGMWVEGQVICHQCYVTRTASHAARVTGFGFLQFQYSKIYSTGNNLLGFLITQASVGYITAGTVIDASSSIGTSGIYCQQNSTGICYQLAGTGYNRIRNQASGITAITGGQVQFTANNQYSGNTVNETPTAASYGYID